MNQVIKRRAPLVIGPPVSIPASTNRWIPKIRVLNRAVPIIAGIALSVHPPHATVVASTKIPNPADVLSSSRYPQASVTRIAPPKFNLPRLSRGRIRIVPATYKRDGYVVKLFTPRNTLPRQKPFAVKIFTPDLRRFANLLGRGSVLKVKAPNVPPTATPKVPRSRVILSTFRRNGSINRIAHPHRTVVIVTSVRPKPVRVILDQFRRNQLLPGRIIRSLPQHEPRLPGNALYACVDTTETYLDHFFNHGWLNPQNQIDAGYPIFIQPTPATGSYEEVIDYGTLINNIIVTVSYSTTVIVDTVTIVTKISTSTDGISYTPFVVGESTFAQSMRYVKLRLEFSGSDAHALIELFNLRVRLDVKREIDSGSVDALAADVGGTVVLFNKAFKDIDSITVTALATTRVTATYDFLDVPNPTQFTVYAWDNTGARVNATVSWKARGIV